MREAIGVFICILGILIMMLGGFGLLIYPIYDIASNWETLTPLQIGKDIIIFLVRDVIAVFTGFIFLIIGKVVIGE
jgi:hypothetical protein